MRNADCGLRNFSWSKERDKFLNGQAAGADEAAQRAGCEFTMVGHRERRPTAVLYQNHVAAFLARERPAVLHEGFDRGPAADAGKRGHGSDGNLDLPGFECQWKAALGAHFEARFYGVAHIVERLCLGAALADAAGYGRAFGNPCAGFVAVDCYGKLHGGKLRPAFFFASLHAQGFRTFRHELNHVLDLFL